MGACTTELSGGHSLDMCPLWLILVSHPGRCHSREHMHHGLNLEPATHVHKAGAWDLQMLNNLLWNARTVQKVTAHACKGQLQQAKLQLARQQHATARACRFAVRVSAVQHVVPPFARAAPNDSNMHTYTRTHARTQACTHAHTHIRGCTYRGTHMHTA